MSRLIITPKEFSDLIMAFLLDKIIHPDEVIPDEDFDKIMKKMGKMGMKPLLMKYYLDMSGDMRKKYKKIKDTLEEGSTRDSTLYIKHAGKTEKDKEGVIKRVIKKLIKHGDMFDDEEKKLILEVLEDE